MSTIAGHTFVDTPGGRMCEGCGKLWVNVARGAYAEIGAPDIAHTGTMNDTERNEIRAEVERIWTAVGKVASGV